MAVLVSVVAVVVVVVHRRRLDRGCRCRRCCCYAASAARQVVTQAIPASRLWTWCVNVFPITLVVWLIAKDALSRQPVAAAILSVYRRMPTRLNRGICRAGVLRNPRRCIFLSPGIHILLLTMHCEISPELYHRASPVRNSLCPALPSRECNFHTRTHTHTHTHQLPHLSCLLPRVNGTTACFLCSFFLF